MNGQYVKSLSFFSLLQFILLCDCQSDSFPFYSLHLIPHLLLFSSSSFPLFFLSSMFSLTIFIAYFFLSLAQCHSFPFLFLSSAPLSSPHLTSLLLSPLQSVQFYLHLHASNKMKEYIKLYCRIKEVHGREREKVCERDDRTEEDIIGNERK